MSALFDVQIFEDSKQGCQYRLRDLSSFVVPYVRLARLEFRFRDLSSCVVPFGRLASSIRRRPSVTGWERACASLLDAEKEPQHSTGSRRYGVVGIDVIIVFSVYASSSRSGLLSIAIKMFIWRRSSSWCCCRSRGTWFSSRRLLHAG
jgi:hypothetical protein